MRPALLVLILTSQAAFLPPAGAQGQPQPQEQVQMQAPLPAPNSGYAPAPAFPVPNSGYAPAPNSNYAPASGYAPAPYPAVAPQARTVAPASMSVLQWFSYYDQIRKQAQMSPGERQRADALLSRGFSVLIPGDEKTATKLLLSSMVGRYQTACDQLRALPQIPQTTNLQHAYFNYFATAGGLFSDYVRVQDNLFVTDASTGQPLASSLIQRKQMLEGLERQCKQLDTQTRSQFGVAPYPW